MLLTIKVINGAEHCIEMSPTESIESVKKVLENELSIPTGQQRLMYKGKPLADGSVLKDCNIQPGSKIHLSLKNVDLDNRKLSNQAESINKANSNKSVITHESLLNKELKNGLKYFNDDINVNEFIEIFNNELEKLADELSLDDIERYNQQRWREEHSGDN